jgi:hypothetical protein
VEQKNAFLNRECHVALFTALLLATADAFTCTPIAPFIAAHANWNRFRSGESMIWTDKRENRVRLIMATTPEYEWVLFEPRPTLGRSYANAICFEEKAASYLQVTGLAPYC